MTAIQEDAVTPWVPDGEQFSSRLALLRHAMGWNAKEAALACNVAAQSWREWEDGRHPRDFEAVCLKIANRTGCDVVWLKSGYTKPGAPLLLPPDGLEPSTARSAARSVTTSVYLNANLSDQPRTVPPRN